MTLSHLIIYWILCGVFAGGSMWLTQQALCWAKLRTLRAIRRRKGR